MKTSIYSKISALSLLGLACMLAFLLAGCGGGGGGNDAMLASADEPTVSPLAVTAAAASCQVSGGATGTAAGYNLLTKGASVTCRWLEGQTLSYSRYQYAVAGATGAGGTYTDCTAAGAGRPRCSAPVSINALSSGSAVVPISLACKSGFTTGGYCQHTLAAGSNQFKAISVAVK